MPSSPVADQIRAKVQSSTTCVKNGAAPQQPRQGVHFGFDETVSIPVKSKPFGEI
jgi:hypothetical protein